MRERFVRVPTRGRSGSCAGRRLFVFNDTATTEIYTLSLHDALPIWHRARLVLRGGAPGRLVRRPPAAQKRSEEHTSELQSRRDLVCRLLLEKKNPSVGGSKAKLPRPAPVTRLALESSSPCLRSPTSP